MAPSAVRAVATHGPALRPSEVPKAVRGSERTAPESTWLFDKKGGVPRLVGIAGVAQSRDYFSAEDEKKLAEMIEAPADTPISKLVHHEPLSDEERLRLSLYIATLFRRVPHRRRKVYETIVPPVLERIISDFRTETVFAAQAAAADPLVLTYRLAQISAYEEKLKQDLPEPLHAAVRSPWPTAKMVVTVYDMAWRVLETHGPVHYLTSDNPAFYFEAFGIGTENSELTLPLSFSHCLHGSWHGPKGGLTFMEAAQPFVHETNRRLASTTERTAFYHQNADWIQPLLQEKQLLNRIQW